MRILIYLTPNTSLVDYNYQKNIAGFFYKYVGREELHGSTSLYSISNLKNGSSYLGQGLNFVNGSSFFISAHDEKIILGLKENIVENQEIFNGMNIFSTRIIPDFIPNEEIVLMTLKSPCLLRGEDGETFLWHQEDAQVRLEMMARRKMKLANIPEDELISIRPDLRYKLKFKSISYKHDGNIIYNKCSLGSAVVKGSRRVLTFLWNVGLGESTGIGFGAVDIQSNKGHKEDRNG